ncbi:hypothetical protein FRC01_001820 [Tulasnella sp. 417]|nr:hypothetical protein FRC01_001820 [Tulasnella sp. 417]
MHRSKPEPREFERLENVVIQDTNFVTTFTPSYAWQKNVSTIASSDGIRTFHLTSNRLAYNSHNAGAMPVTQFTAQCDDLTVYGASPAQLRAALPEGFRHGHLQICRNRNCEYIDVHQAYLHVPEHLPNEPVLLYGTDGMSPGVSETIRIKLLDPPSPVDHLWAMSFSHAVCSQVVPKWPGTHPIPDGRYSTHVTQFDRLTYEPSYSFGAHTPWTRKDLYSSAPATPFWFSGKFRGMPSWSTTVQGHEIQIRVPSPALFLESRYANMLCCLDGRCHYPDIEQWLLNGTDTNSDVVLVHYKDLNPFKDHRVSMTAVRRDDEVGEKIIAVSRVVYEQVVVTGRNWPIHYPDGGIRALTLVALAIMGCFTLVLIIKARRQPPKRDPLGRQPLPQSILPSAAPVASPVDTLITYPGYFAPPPYGACTTPSGNRTNHRPHPPMTGAATPPPY